MFSIREETDFAENHYYRVNQILLSMVSLWPTQQSKFTKINNIFHFSIMWSLVIFQLTSFLTFQFTMDFCILALSHAVPSLLFIIQYYTFYANPNKIMRLWTDMRDSWSFVKNETERNIMQQHSSSGELRTILMTSSIFASLILYAFILMFPAILDLIFPLNETRPLDLHVALEYFVDEETYFYPILCHWLFSLSFGAYVFVATGTFEVIYLENACGLIRIASYRIESTIEKFVSTQKIHNSTQKEDCLVHQNLTTAVDIHRKALEHCGFITNSLSSYIFLIVVIGVASTSLNLFRFLRALVTKSIYEFISSGLFISFHFIFMFLGNYYGQKVTDCNNEIFNTAYSVPWYKIPIRIQKVLLFIMQNTTTPYILNIGNLILASIEGFAKLISMSMSYFTIIYTLL